MGQSNKEQKNTRYNYSKMSEKSKITIILDNSEISCSTIKHFFTKIYQPNSHEIQLIYAAPNFSVSKRSYTERTISVPFEQERNHNNPLLKSSSYPKFNPAELKNDGNEVLLKTIRELRQCYNVKQEDINSEVCVFGMSENDEMAIEKREQNLEEVIGKNLVKSVMEYFGKVEQPDGVVFACRGYLRLKSVLSDFGQFFRAAQLLKHRCSIDYSASKERRLSASRRASIIKIFN